MKVPEEDTIMMTTEMKNCVAPTKPTGHNADSTLLRMKRQKNCVAKTQLKGTNADQNAEHIMKEQKLIHVPTQEETDTSTQEATERDRMQVPALSPLLQSTGPDNNSIWLETKMVLAYSETNMAPVYKVSQTKK